MNKEMTVRKLYEADTEEEEDIDKVIELIKATIYIKELENIRIHPEYEIFCNIFNLYLLHFATSRK